MLFPIREIRSIATSDEYCKLEIKNVTLEELKPYRFFKGKEFGASLNGHEKGIAPLAFKGINVKKNIRKLAPTATILYAQKEEIPSLSNFYHWDIRGDAYTAGLSPNGLAQRSIDICDKNKPNLLLEYNCIGYALGLAEWIPPDSLGLTVNTKKQVILRGINKAIKKAKEYNHIVVPHEGKTLKAYTISEYKKLSAEYDDIALYFKDGKLRHAAKYGADNGEKTIRCWNSKFGAAPVFCHGIDNVSDDYGEVGYYLKWDAVPAGILDKAAPDKEL